VESSGLFFRPYSDDHYLLDHFPILVLRRMKELQDGQREIAKAAAMDGE
jgi:hypothetical protein